MSFRKNLKRVSSYVFLGSCLIFIGLVVLSCKNPVVVKAPSTSSSPSFLPTSSTYAKVTRVIDGDTIVIDTGAHVRYIGMNTPEVETNECFNSEATKVNKDLVLGKVVRLEKDVSEADKYGRLLRYVYVGDIFVDDYLVKKGYAKIMIVQPDIKHEDEFLQSEKFAKESKLGLWGKCRQSL
jgi:micrococcal nuclease